MKEFIEKLIGRLEELAKEREDIKNKLLDNEQSDLVCIYDVVDEEEFKIQSYKESIEIVNQLAQEYMRETPTVTNGWIPCKERLPENNKVVLCWVVSTTIASGETFIIGSCDRGFWFLQTYEIGHHHFPVKDYEVVAWQPLPAPYQKGGAD